MLKSLRRAPALTESQLELLRTIAADPRSRCPVPDEVFRAAAGLEAAGLLELELLMTRIRDLRRAPWRWSVAEDRRPYQARLTPAGRRALEQL